MNPQDYHLLLIESPYEYTPSEFYPDAHEERRENSANTLVTLTRSFDAAGVPVRGVSDIQREPGKWDEYICEKLGKDIQYLPFPWQESPNMEEDLIKILGNEETPRILLTGGYIHFDPKKNLLGACVGERAGWLMQRFREWEKQGVIHVDARSAVVDLIDSSNGLPQKNLYLVKSSIDDSVVSPITKEPFRSVIVQAI